MKPRQRSHDPFASLHTLSQPARGVQPAGIGPRTITAANEPPMLPPLHYQVQTRSVLEVRYPGMAQAISLLWGQPEMNQYFEKLWLGDERSLPIEPDAMSELMFLAQLHLCLMPRKPRAGIADIYASASSHSQPPSAKRDPWGEAQWSHRR